MDSSMSVHTFAKFVLNTIEHFLCSVETKIDKVHAEKASRSHDAGPLPRGDFPMILKNAQKIWDMMINPEDRGVRITHDVYLKLYQMSFPKLIGYQCIMVDEAQDCNPAMLSIMLSQKLPVILVGDPNQQIYGFRGATNALGSIKSTHTYHLTKSFRFGPEISYIASCCLEFLNNEHQVTIVGSPKPSHVDGRVEGQYAIVARSNATLFNEAVRVCVFKRFKAKEPTTVMGAFAGGLNSYGLDQLLDLVALREVNYFAKNTMVIKDKFISKFSSFAALSSYAQNVEDQDLLTKIEIVNTHGRSLVDYVKTIKEKCNYPMHQANYIFTTAHKSKGLEFDTVCLTEDYPVLEYHKRLVLHSELPLPPSSKMQEEGNVLYVAATRAKKCLVMPHKFFQFLNLSQEKFEFPVSSKQALNGADKLFCANCQKDFIPHTALILSRRHITLATGQVVYGGPMCMKCGSQPTFRPSINYAAATMLLNPTPDHAHRSLAHFVGPLPTDPPIVRDSVVVREMNDVYIVVVDF